MAKQVGTKCENCKKNAVTRRIAVSSDRKATGYEYCMSCSWYQTSNKLATISEEAYKFLTTDDIAISGSEILEIEIEIAKLHKIFHEESRDESNE